MKCVGLSILLVALLAADTGATGCRVVVGHRVVAPVVVTPVAVAVPVYSAVYGGPDQGVQQLLAEVQKLRQEVQQFRGPEVLPAKASLLQQRCAACHTAGSEKGKFALFDKGGRAALTPEQLGDALGAVVSGAMPKGVKVTAEERLGLVAELMSKGG